MQISSGNLYDSLQNLYVFTVAFCHAGDFNDLYSSQQTQIISLKLLGFL